MSSIDAIREQTGSALNQLKQGINTREVSNRLNDEENRRDIDNVLKKFLTPQASQ